MAWYDDEDALGLDWGDNPLFDFPSIDALDMDWGNAPSFEFPSFDALDMDWGANPSFDFPSIDALDLDWGSNPLFDFPATDALDMDWGESPLFDFPSTDALDMDWGDASSVDIPVFDEELPGGAIGIPPASEIDLFGGVKFPDQKVDIPATSLYKAADEVAEEVPGEGLKEPEMPGLSSMGGGQGIYVEVPAEFDENGDLIEGSGGYVGELGFVPYDAVASLGDPSSWINRPDLLGKTVIGQDMVKSADLEKGTTTTTTPSGTTTTKTPTDTKTVTEKETNTITKAINQLLGTNASNKDMAMWAALLGGILGLLGNKGGGAAPGYTGGIPKYTATRGTPVSPTAGGRRAGGAGLGSLTGGVTYTKAAQGGLMDVLAGQPNESVLMMAKGGETGRYLRGATDGMADKIYTDIDGQQPARLSHGEFVIPADVVSHLGNGNSDAGAKELHEMMNRVRKARTGTTKQGKEIKPRKHMAA